MKNFAEQILGVNNKCMAIEDEACASVDGFSKPNADIMKEIEPDISYLRKREFIITRWTNYYENKIERYKAIQFLKTV